MKLSQVKGSTWIAEGTELIPFYKLDDRRCILLDSGLLEEREELEQALLSAGLAPAGVLCSHAHVDHCASNGYFQEKYRIPVALTAPEAGMCSSILNLKSYFLLLTPDTVEREFSSLVHRPDVLIPPEDGPFSFAGAQFQILHTPGHSSGHISLVTPDNVCYAADALFSQDRLTSKLPYSLCHKLSIASREKLRGLNCDAYIMAHRGICSREEIDGLIDANQALIRQRAEELLALADLPITASQLSQAICARYQLFTRRPGRALRFERNVRLLTEYLLDEGRLELRSVGGVPHYCRARPSASAPPEGPQPFVF